MVWSLDNHPQVSTACRRPQFSIALYIYGLFGSTVHVLFVVARNCYIWEHIGFPDFLVCKVHFELPNPLCPSTHSTDIPYPLSVKRWDFHNTSERREFALSRDFIGDSR